MLIGSAQFDHVWVADYEYRSAPGETPAPHTMVAHDITTGQTHRLFGSDLKAAVLPPFNLGSRDLFVSFYAAAEISCYLALGWPIPPNVLDLYAEFRVATNGIPLPCGKGLLGAAAYYGLSVMDIADKESMRLLAMRGPPYTDEERSKLLSYCSADVETTCRLLERMAPQIDIDRALIRGRYGVAVAKMEAVGIPIDSDSLTALQRHWPQIGERFIATLDPGGLYQAGSFSQARFTRWLSGQKIPWPCHASGRIDLSEETFKAQAEKFPAVKPLQTLRRTLAQLRLLGLEVGSDGRSRCMLSPFASKTGRNQPSTKRFVFGLSRWLRGLVQPAPGMALAYIDYSQQEFAIAAYLSRDTAMIEAYNSSDPYITFGQQAGSIPPDGTKASHPRERELFKQCALGVLFGMGEETLACRIGCTQIEARELIHLHRRTYPQFWTWSQAAVDHAMLLGTLYASLGWQIQVGAETSGPKLRNFPMQANGAEMLRLACIIATEAGIRVCAPVHDALLIEAPETEIETAVAATKDAMRRASRIVLSGGEVKTDVCIVRHPDRLLDPSSKEMWRLAIATATELKLAS